MTSDTPDSKHAIKPGLSDTIQLTRQHGCARKNPAATQRICKSYPLLTSTHINITVRKIFCVALHHCPAAPFPGGFSTGTCVVEDSAKLTSLNFSLASTDFKAASRTRRGFDVVGARSTLAGLDLRPGMAGRRLRRRYQTGGNG